MATYFAKVKLRRGSHDGEIPGRQLERWASSCSLLLTLVVIPLFHTFPLPKREMLTMLYLQPPAAGCDVTRLQAPTPAYTPTSIAAPTPS